MMYDHIGLRIQDLEASVRFYKAALASLGHGLCFRDEAGAGFGPEAAPALWLHAAAAPHQSGAHIAFRAATRAAVDAFLQAGLDAGGRDHGAPGLRREYSPDYYAAFLLDPDGNNIEAVCLAGKE
jgi:catechol 2,3-dioxygenase-like lactoylglutathione lyase family enzyme